MFPSFSESTARTSAGEAKKNSFSIIRPIYATPREVLVKFALQDVHRMLLVPELSRDETLHFGRKSGASGMALVECHAQASGGAADFCFPRDGEYSSRFSAVGREQRFAMLAEANAGKIGIAEGELSGTHWKGSAQPEADLCIDQAKTVADIAGYRDACSQMMISAGRADRSIICARTTPVGPIEISDRFAMPNR